MKISESFEIRVNIVKILRNKQTKKIVTTYLPQGWGKLFCYTLYNNMFSTFLAQPDMVQGLIVCAWVCECRCVPLCLFVCVLVIRLCVKRRMMKIMNIDLNRCYEKNHLNLFFV